jgi:hypothetical protein
MCHESLHIRLKAWEPVISSSYARIIYPMQALPGLITASTTDINLLLKVW